MGTKKGYWKKNEEWISVPDDHLLPIIDNPERFDLTRDQIETIYTSNGETVGNDGRARDTIIRKATENGWIRVRYYDNMGSRIIVQGYGLDGQVASLQDFIQEIVKHGPIDDSTTVVISDLNGCETRSFRVGPSGITDNVEGDLDRG